MPLSKPAASRRPRPTPTTTAPTMLDALLATAIADRAIDPKVRTWLQKMVSNENVMKVEKPKAA